MIYTYIAQRLCPVRYAKSIGVNVGKKVIFESFNFGSEPWLITIGSHVEICPNVHFITHDGATWVFRNEEKYKKVLRYGKIEIKDNCFIGLGSIIMPGVIIGENSVIGAGSVVTSNVAPNTVVAGNPAKKICSLQDYKEKCLQETPLYDEEEYRRNKREEVLRFLNRKE